mgnify:FL=1
MAFYLQVIDKVAVVLADLAELPRLGDHKKVGELVMNALLHESGSLPSPSGHRSLISPKTKQVLHELASLRQKIKREKDELKEDLQIKQAAALVVKLEGNSRFSSGDIIGASSKYTEALSLCPLRAKKERVVLYSNRAQCHLLLQDPWAAISDTTRALCLHNPVNCHGKSLWRRAQAYEILGFAKESLLDAIMFINECSQAPEGDLSLKQNRVPDYAEKLVKKQMQSAWLFNEACQKHGGIQYDHDVEDDEHDDEGSEWETASGSYVENEEKEEKSISGGEDCQWPTEDEKGSIQRLVPIFNGVTLEDLLGPHCGNA